MPTKETCAEEIASAQPPAGLARTVPGLLLAVVLAVVATAIGRALPLLGAPVAGILLGVALSGPLRSHRALRPGIRLAAGTVLQVAVVLLGAQLSLRQLAHAGASSLPVMLGTLAVCLTAAYLLGRALGIDADLRTLIGVGTAICGASAIAATSPVIKARGAAVAYAVTTIFCFNIAAVLVFPPLGHLLHLSQHSFGVFAGTAVNDTSSVVAAATTYGTQATDQAVVVKLTRTLLIIPICLVLGLLTRRREEAAGSRPPLLRQAVGLVPWFLVGFVVLAAANSLGRIPAAAAGADRQVATFLICVALAGIGMSTDVAALRQAGPRPLVLGGALWVAVAASSLLLQWAAS
ncbi:MAG: YeiH family protein [Marmoricola sp.]